MRFLRPMINVYNVVKAERHDVIYPQNFERVGVMGEIRLALVEQLSKPGGVATCSALTDGRLRLWACSVPRFDQAQKHWLIWRRGRQTQSVRPANCLEVSALVTQPATLPPAVQFTQSRIVISLNQNACCTRPDGLLNRKLALEKQKRNPVEQG